VFSTLPITRNRDARNFFFATVLVSVVLVAWLDSLRDEGGAIGFSFIFMKLLVQEDLAALMWMLLTLAALMLVPAWPGARRFAAAVASRPWTVCLLTAAALSASSLLVYQAHPLSMDEYAQVFQSQVFASGHLTGRFPLDVMNWLIPPQFQNIFLRVSPATGAVVSAYWPSFALLLAPFSWLGIPWACNPVLSALTIAAVRKLALALFGSLEAAGIAMLLTLASPVFFADGISFYTMTAHMLLNCVFMLLLLAPTPWRLFLAGAVGAVALTLHNSLPHTLFALPWIVWLAVRGTNVRGLACLAAGYLSLGLPLLVGWAWFSYELMHQGVAAASADQVKTLGSLLTWPTFQTLLSRLMGMAKVWIWAVPGLPLLACIGAWRRRGDLHCLLLAASAVLTFAGYLFFRPDQGHGWGFRYFHSAWMTLPLLAAGALARRQDDGERDLGPLVAMVTAAALLSLVVGVGVRAAQIGDYMATSLRQLPAYEGLEPRVVLINPRTTAYGGDLVQNDPFLRGDVIRLFIQQPDEVAATMHRLRPGFHRVYSDKHGEVWSAAGH
jgi:hypothetical protein